MQEKQERPGAGRRTEGGLFKRGDTYWVRWVFEGQEYRRTTGCTAAREAKAAAEEILAPFLQKERVEVVAQLRDRVDRGEALLAEIEEKDNPPLTLPKAWDTYLASPDRPDSGPETLKQYESHCDQFVGWMRETHSKVTAMRDVTPEVAREYASHLLKRGLSPNRYNKHLAFLGMFWRVLATPARAPVSPWDGIKRRMLTTQGRRELTVDELRRVCQAATGELRLLLAVGVYTGLRLHDSCCLRWGEVDLVRDRITRIPSKTARRNPKPVLIPLHRALRGMLEEIPQSKRRGFVLPEMAETYTNSPDRLNNVLRDHFEACGVTVHRAGTGVEVKTGEDGKEVEVHSGKRAVVEVGFHSLRHSFVSLCRAANAPLAVVEAIVGHSSPAMTRHYTHTSEEAAGAAVAALPVVIGTDPHPALPSPTGEAGKADWRGRVRELAEGLTKKTLEETKAALLALANE